jgi:2-methylcitrate dehydratase PrpD
MAAAEAAGVDGPTLLRAIVGGYEVFARLGAAINPEHLSQGFHPSGTVGAVAAAAAASLVFDSGASASLENAMSLAAAASGGLMEHSLYGDMSSYFVGGNAARVGVEAAILAREGMTGPLTVLEGKYGMAAAMANGTLRTSELVDSNPDGPRILDTYTKVYPSCRHTHAAIEAALCLRSQIPTPKEIQSVQVGIYQLAIDECDRPSVHTLAGAESSLQMTVALALVNGEVSLKNRAFERYLDPDVQLLSKRIQVVHEPAFDGLLPNLRPAEIRLTTAGQQVLQLRIDLPRGEPERALKWEELAEKAWSATCGVLTPSQFTALENAVTALESAPSLHQLAEAITTNTL